MVILASDRVIILFLPYFEQVRQKWLYFVDYRKKFSDFFGLEYYPDLSYCPLEKNYKLYVTLRKIKCDTRKII